MKWMKKLRLINWHYFLDETMEFGKQTLITGQNAAGKSTIIDALQVLFIADQRQIRFNPAAHEEAKRSIINYLKGKIGSDDRTFLRDGDFTTYIAAEFRDDLKKESFVIGVIIDVFRDQRYEEEYFILADHRLEDVDLIKPSGHLRNRDEFKRRHVEPSSGGRTRTIFERNKSQYQKALLARLGTLHERFFSIFIKALSFKPIHNVRDFVYDYILDKRELQLDLMKQNFEIHERYKLELEQLELRKSKLLKIREQYEHYKKLHITIQEQDYVIRRLKWFLEEETLSSNESDYERLEQSLAKLEGDISVAWNKYEDAKREAEQALTIWKGHDVVKKEEELKKAVDDLELRNNSLHKELGFSKRSLEEELRIVEDLLAWQGNDSWSWNDIDIEALNSGTESIVMAIKDIEQALDPNYCSSNESVSYEPVKFQLHRLGAHLNSVHERMIIEWSRVDERKKLNDSNIDELDQIIRDLENQKRRYPHSVTELKRLLEQKLGDRSSVWIFCEEMEVEDENWRNAVEGYLNTQRFDVLVEPRVFTEALSVYEREKIHNQLEGVGLVDTDKEQRYLNSSESNSLAQILKTGNPIIRAHMEHLLGRVMKADNEQELRKHRTAVTQSCMVYNKLVARQMKRSQYELPYIGAKAIARQLELKKRELEEAREESEKLHAILEHYLIWTKRLNEKQSRYERLSEQLDLINQLQHTRSDIDLKRKELARLDLTEAIRLEEVFNHWRQQETDWNNRWAQLGNDKSGKETEKKQLVAKIYIQKNKEHDAKDEFDRWSQENDISLLAGAQSRFTDAEKQDAPTFKKIENWTGNQKGNITRRDEAKNELRNLRLLFNTEHLFDGVVGAEDNETYVAALKTIENLNIPEYQFKVQKSLEDSEEEFKSHFVFKLREAIEMARREFHELNHALKNFPFSQDRYYFEVSPSQKYRRFYDAVMNPMLAEKGSLFDIPDNDSSETMNELFEMLVRGEAGDLEEFTDYRCYLDFDMIVYSNESKYRFSQVLKEKSGGETQTPFYIAILASFYHLYKSHKTSRLVVFDEAFNKMDEQRIQSSLRLIKQLNLQLIAAVPDEKMQHMAPEVSTTLIVTNQNYQCFVDMVDRWDLEQSDVEAEAEVGINKDEDEESIKQEELF
jgi:energy-coupling factor transporter ATP-binding protein EcfA2